MNIYDTHVYIALIMDTYNTLKVSLLDVQFLRGSVVIAPYGYISHTYI